LRHINGQPSRQKSRTGQLPASVSDLVENSQLRIRRSLETVSLSPCVPHFITSESYLPQQD